MPGFVEQRRADLLAELLVAAPPRARGCAGRSGFASARAARPGARRPGRPCPLNSPSARGSTPASTSASAGWSAMTTGTSRKSWRARSGSSPSACSAIAATSPSLRPDRAPPPGARRRVERPGALPRRQRLGLVAQVRRRAAERVPRLRHLRARHAGGQRPQARRAPAPRRPSPDAGRQSRSQRPDRPARPPAAAARPASCAPPRRRPPPPPAPPSAPAPTGTPLPPPRDRPRAARAGAPRASVSGASASSSANASSGDAHSGSAAIACFSRPTAPGTSSSSRQQAARRKSPSGDCSPSRSARRRAVSSLPASNASHAA